MELSKTELVKEEKRLADTIKVIKDNISSLGKELYQDEEKMLEFKKYMWDAKGGMDGNEISSLMADNDMEINILERKNKYLMRLFRVEKKPYFGRIIFKDEDEENDIYIGITHVEDKLNFYVHDWRSPICSLFYDYELGKASYKTPAGTVSGEITLKRQYKIEDGKLLNVFDNNINIEDEVLQDVLANNSSDKMKNIVNTIQEEQNKVIRNVNDRNLIVQGIAGSGKTSVALHRIAFLLYRIPNLTSNNVLIFSPNSIFSEYISNVLPELGEDNTKETTYNTFLKASLKEFDEIESFASFIERYYKYNVSDVDLIKYKQSDEIVNDITSYVNDLTNEAIFKDDLITRDFVYTADELNDMLKNRYSRFPLFLRITSMADKISEINYNSNMSKSKSICKMLFDKLNVDKDYAVIYMNFFKSKYAKIKSNSDINHKSLNYEDACLLVYLKGILEGFNYNTYIKQVVIDEAQDYTKLQYMIIKKIFRNASFTILGDTNQTINPYYKYNSLKDLDTIFDESKYIELTKTYRSSEEIVEYANKILGLDHVSAIRRGVSNPIIMKQESSLHDDIVNDLNMLKAKSKSVAVICKNDTEVDKIYDLIKADIKCDVIKSTWQEYKRNLVIIPAYIAKGLEFDSVIIYTSKDNKYKDSEKHLYYVAVTRAQHNLIVYNQ